MKKIKYSVSLFLLIFCLLISGELYQNHLESFTNGLYYFNAASDSKSQFSDIQYICKENNCEVFCIKRKTKSMLETSITIFADKKTVERIKNECSIASGEYNSLFSGSTTVYFKDFLSAPATDTTFYFFGNEDNIKLVRNIFCQTYGGGAVHKTNIDDAQWLLCVLWIIFATLFLLLTWFDIQFQKKENFILISLGKSAWAIIFKNILKDTSYLCILYPILCFLLNKETYVMYRQRESLLILISIIVINSILYFSMHKYDLKKALSSSNFSNVVLSNCYLIKAISLIITVIVLSTNVLVILENGNILMQYKKISEYEGYQFVDIYFDSTSDSDYKELENGQENAGAIAKKIFYDLYRENAVAFSVVGMTSNDCKYLLVDKNSKNLISHISELEKIDWKKDYYILVPDNYKTKDNASEALEVFEIFFEEIANICTYDTLSYKGNHNIVYFKNESDNVISGFETTSNPVIILCNFYDTTINAALKNGRFSSDDSLISNMMFKFTDEDINLWREQFDFKGNSLNITATPVTDKANYVKSAVERIVLLNTVISLFMILLEFMIMTTTVKLEYTVNAMTVSLKKILGYSILKRNQGVFGLNFFSVFIATFTSVMISIMSLLEIWNLSLVIGLAVLIVESITITHYVIKLDKIHVPKILKGGCL